MCGIKAVLCCCGLPLSALVVIVAVMVPQLLPKDPCQVDVTGACKRVQGSGPAACDAGVFLELARQPTLGLRHLPVGKKDLAFAKLTRGDRTATYSLVCGADGSVQLGDSSATEHLALGTSWEVCAKGAEVELLLPVVDLTFGVETSGHVDGCVRISAAKRLPHLGSVRGSIPEQQAALEAKKEEMGGCPSWASDSDRLDRGEDFATAFGQLNGWFVRQMMKCTKDVAVRYRLGDIPQGRPVWDLLLFVGIMASGGGEAAATTLAPLIYCGAPGVAAVPAVNSLQVTRHAEIARLIADPNQKRRHQIGGGNSEVCFEPTMPVFLSTGEAPHTQTRKLWDAVGLAEIAEGEIPEIVPPPEVEGAFYRVRRAAMSAAGMDAPFLDELALYVTPLFLEKLWGKKPTAEESGFIARYGTFGGPCIMSQIVERLPILPGKIRAIRAAALAFARESPVGKKMAEEIHKPEYAELKALYASRPMGAVDGALGALTDASLFAGLIGTSTMAMNAMLQIHRGPQYLKMFRKNSTAFMLEVMRTATAVAGSLRSTSEPWNLTMAGERVEVPPGNSVMQLTGFAGGLDAAVFPDPYKFDSGRANLGETMNFNGLSKHVLTRNYAGAPRFCPGAAVSIKIATKVTEYFTKGMPEA